MGIEFPEYKKTVYVLEKAEHTIENVRSYLIKALAGQLENKYNNIKFEGMRI